MNKYVTQVKSALLTALVVIILMQLVTAMIVPFAGLIISALILVGVGGYLYQRFKRP